MLMRLRGNILKIFFNFKGIVIFFFRDVNIIIFMLYRGNNVSYLGNMVFRFYFKI